MRLFSSVALALAVSGCPANVMCIRAIQCVAACGETPINAGCGPCPSGTFDDFACRDAGAADGGSMLDAPSLLDSGGGDAGASDAGSTLDTPASAPDGVACGGLDCAAGERCCSTGAGRSCAPATDACTGAIGIEACDGPEDCGGGEACCVTLDGAGTLVSACAPAGSCPGTAGGDPPWRSCHAAGECAAATACCPSPTPELSASICGIGC